MGILFAGRLIFNAFLCTFFVGSSFCAQEERLAIVCAFSFSQYNTFPMHTTLQTASLKKNGLLIVEEKYWKPAEWENLKSEYSKVYALQDYHGGELEYILTSEHLLHPFSRVIAMDEYDLVRIGRLRDVLKIPGQSFLSACAFRDKIEMKQLVSNSGLITPDFAPLISPCDVMSFKSRVGYPFIIKPARDSSSRGITIIRNDQDLKLFMCNFMGALTPESFGNEKRYENRYEKQYILEKFITGRVFHINGILANGKLLKVWPSVYINSGLEMQSGKIFGWHILEKENQLVPRLIEFTKRILEALPTPQDTAFHLEAFLTPLNEILFCEIASRAGGAGIREDWIESFGFDMLKDFTLLQGGKYVISDADMNISPKTITGWIFVPQVRGKVLSIPSLNTIKSKFSPWLKNCYVDVEEGQLINSATQIHDTMCRIQLSAENEEQFLQRVREFQEWFYNRTKIQEDVYT